MNLLQWNLMTSGNQQILENKLRVDNGASFNIKEILKLKHKQ